MTSYKESGVDQNKADEIISSFSTFLKTRPKDPNVVAGIGPYASCYALGTVLKSVREPLLATTCDGVGTKCLLAQEWQEISGLGQDLVAMNVNDLLCVGALPLLFLDYYACGSLDSNLLTGVLKSIQKGCELARCSLVGGETAEMPGLYRNQDFDLAGFAVGVVDRAKMLGAHRVTHGSDLIALESTGFHSNGFSLIRKLVKDHKLSPSDLALDLGKSWREILLAPTQIYVESLAPILDKVQAAAHITGGGLFENLVRVIPEGARAKVEKGLWKIPPLFLWAQNLAGLSEKELFTTFNCGVGMILIVAPLHSSDVIRRIEESGVRAWSIGKVELSSAKLEPQVEFQ